MNLEQNQSIPNEQDEANSTRASEPVESGADQRTERPAPGTTQGDFGDGAGLRGGYGDSDQTNGLEGGANEKAENQGSASQAGSAGS